MISIVTEGVNLVGFKVELFESWSCVGIRLCFWSVSLFGLRRCLCLFCGLAAIGSGGLAWQFLCLVVRAHLVGITAELATKLFRL